MNVMRKASVILGIVTVLAVFLLTNALKVQAAWPEKPITIYITFAAGGSTDAAARALGPGLEKALGQPLVYVNKPGGTGTVAMGVLAGEKPDGYTLAVGVNSAIIWNPILRKMPYRPLSSFTPVFCFGTAPTGVVVRSDAPYKTWQEFVEYARANPGKIKYSTTGATSPFYVGMRYASKKLGMKLIHIPYKGSMPAYTALLGGHVEACVGDSKFYDFVKSGQMRLLATLTQERLPEFPDTPTLIELGINYYNRVGVYSVFGPAGMDPAIVKKLEDAVITALDTEAFKNMSRNFMFMPWKMRSKEFGKMLENNWVENVALLKELDIVKEAATPSR